ncbi:GspH/FimT family pseudopilin [Alteromonas flava]|uniref:GspH/FimT family pseudopilin n=1 Tax=Alteromonas flava TaxID=2048003 RepID=UPI0013DAF281|nr:GspH/FimT family pseudopilin [Alteromonas flava]
MRAYTGSPVSGATLTELMVALGISSFLLTTAVPPLSELYRKSQIIAELNSLSGVIQATRALAIDQQRTLSLCPTQNWQRCDFSDWTLGKMVFDDRDGDKHRDPNEPLLLSSGKIDNQIKSVGPKRHIRFHANGQTATPATLTLCPTQKTPQLNRALIVSMQGRIKLSRDTNGDGIHELNNGKAIKC